MEDEYSAGSVSHLAVAMLYVRSLLLSCRAAVLWPPENKRYSVSSCFDSNAALRGWVRTMSMGRVRNEFPVPGIDPVQVGVRIAGGAVT